MTRREVIEELKAMKKRLPDFNASMIDSGKFGLMHDFGLTPPAEEIIKAINQVNQDIKNQIEKEDKKIKEAIDIVIEILENMSDERFESRGNKCQLN